MTNDELYKALGNELFENWLKIDRTQEKIEAVICQNTEQLTKLLIAGIGILIILGLIILWNQRKIKKMLRDLQEQNRKDDDGSN
ncbi:MAG: hypothetical protein IKU20_08880 [Lachnospiraceae bacterium]|nr:hypothetical protein [Lachnospiraceae bacterium]